MARTFAEMIEIPVPSENSPNPFANEIQNYLYEHDDYNYKQLYGNTPPPVQTQASAQPTAFGSSPNYSATATNNWQIQSTTAAPQNSNTFGSTQQPSQPAGFTPSPIQPMSQTPAAVANQTGQSSGSTSLFDNPDAIKQQNGQPSPVMQAIYRYLNNIYEQFTRSRPTG